MIPEYISYRLTGVMKNEYTNATTGAIVGAESKKRDTELLKLLGIKTDIFEELSGYFLPLTRYSLGGCRMPRRG